MKTLSEKQIKTLITLVVRAEDNSITESAAAVYGELHSVLVDMLAVLPTSRAADGLSDAAHEHQVKLVEEMKARGEL